MDEENPPPPNSSNNNSNNNPSPLNRPYRIRRSSSSTISSTTSPAFPVPSPQSPFIPHRSRLAASLHASLSNSRSSSNNHHNNNLNNNQNNAHMDLDEDQPSSSTAFMPPSPQQPRSLRERDRPHLNLNVAGSSSTSSNNAGGSTNRSHNHNSGPASPLGSPDSTYWGPAPSPINNYHHQRHGGGPPTPGGMCVVSSSTVDDVPPSPLQFAEENNISVGVLNSNSVNNNSNNNNVNVMLPPLPVAPVPAPVPTSTAHSQNSQNNSSSSSSSSSSNSSVNLRNSLSRNSLGLNGHGGLILNVNSSADSPSMLSIASSSSASSSSATNPNNLNLNQHTANPHVNVIASSHHHQERDQLNFSLNPVRSKIKKASSFERFSLQQAASASSSLNNSSSSSSSQQNTNNSSSTSTSGNSHNPDLTATNQQSQNFTSSNSSSSTAAAAGSSGTGSRFLWDSLLQSVQNSSSSSNSNSSATAGTSSASIASSSATSSTLRQIFTASSNGMSGDLKSLHIKIPSKKLAAKIASVFEQEEQQLLLQQQQQQHQNDLISNLMNQQQQQQSHQLSNSNNSSSSTSSSAGLLNEDAVAGIDLISDVNVNVSVNEPNVNDHESLIRELQISESPLNLTENNSNNNTSSGSNSNVSANAAANNNSSRNPNQRNPNFITTTVTTTTTTAIAIPTKKIPLTPKQKLLHRMQSGELLSLSPPPPVNCNVNLNLQGQGPSPSISQSVSSNPNQLLQQQLSQPSQHQSQGQSQSQLQQSSLTFQHQQQSLLADSLQQHQSHSPPPQLVDPYAYESLLRSRDDFISVQDNLGLSKNGLDGDASGVSGVLYDPDAYSYYYSSMLGEEIFSSSSSGLTNGSNGGSSSNGVSSIQGGSLSSGSNRPLLMLPQSSASLQDDGHSHVEFILGIDEADPDHDPHNTLNVVRGNLRDDHDQQQHDHEHEHDMQLGSGPNGGHSGNVGSPQHFLDPSEFKSQDSTLRNLLMMGPMQPHEDTTWLSATADYQSQGSSSNGRLNGGSNGGGRGQGLSSLSSSNNQGSIIGGMGSMGMSNGSGNSSSSLQNALNLNINLNNSWMALANDWPRNSWPHSMMGMSLSSQQDEQDEVMDMSVMDSPDKHSMSSSNKRHVSHLDDHHDHDHDHDHMDDVDLVEASGLPLLTSMPMQMPMDLQLQQGLMGSTSVNVNGLGGSSLSLQGGSGSQSSGQLSTISMMSSKGQQILVHDSSNSGSGSNDPINLQHRHRLDDDEPVNLMSAVSLDNDLSLHQQQGHHQQHSHHNHSQHQSHGHHGQHQHQQLTSDDLDHLPNGVTVVQHSSILASHQHHHQQQQQQQQQLHSNSRHISQTLESSKQQSQQMQCGGYITLHAATPQGNEYQAENQSLDNSPPHSGQGQVSNNVHNHTSGLSSIHLAETNCNNNNNPSDSNTNDDNIDERRIIRVKKIKEVVNSISGNHGNGTIFMSGALSPEDTLAALSGGAGGGSGKSSSSLTSSGGGNGVASIILDKPIQPKSFASLPSPLGLIRVPGDDWAVFTARYKTIAVNTRFGPVEGPLERAFKEDLSNVNTAYPCLVMLDSSNTLWQLDRTDDELCNWMKFVRMSRNPSEQNAVIIEDRGLLYFSTTKDIPPKTELQVGYSLEYMQKYGLSYYSGSSSGEVGVSDSSLTDEQMQINNASGPLDSQSQHHQQGQNVVSVSLSGSSSLTTGDSINDSDPNSFVSMSLPSHSHVDSNEHTDDHRLRESQSRNVSVSDHLNATDNLTASSSNGNSDYVELYPCFECQDDFASVDELNVHLDTFHREPDVIMTKKAKKRNVKKLKFLDEARTTNDSTIYSSNSNNNIATSGIKTGGSRLDKIKASTLSNGTTTKTQSPAQRDGGFSGEPIKKGKYECNTCKAIVPTLVDLTKHASQHYDEQGIIFVENDNINNNDDGQGQSQGEGVVTSGTAEQQKQPQKSKSINLKNNNLQKTNGTLSLNSNVLKTVLTSLSQSNLKSPDDSGGSVNGGGAAVAPDGGMTPSTKAKCALCYKSFATKDRLDKHMIVHSDEETKPLKCEFCPKRFLTNSALAGHIKTHAEEGKCFECPMCEFVTQQLLQLKEHVQTHKNKENGMFYCPKCSKKFSMYSMVRKHIRAFHGPRQFACDQCTMSFPTSDKLKLHKLKHSDHREFLCAECGRQFKRKDKLREHAKRMHENRKKPLDIHHLPGHLTGGGKNRHAKKFVPKTSPEEFEKFVYKCSDCMMGFKRRGMLVNHLAKRHPEKPPQQVPELNMPILRPTRNYFCPYCDRVYKSSSKRKSHILKSHPGKPVPPQLKGKESLTVNDGEKLITVSVNSVLSSTNELKMMVNGSGNGSVNNGDKLKPTGAVADSNGEQVFPVSIIVPDKHVSSMSSGDSEKNQPQQQQQQRSTPQQQHQYREVSVVGKVMANPHSCQWCHRQYATRAKLLQHQRKSHLHLMPPDMQLPRTQKNNVVRVTTTSPLAGSASVSTSEPTNNSRPSTTNSISSILSHSNNNNNSGGEVIIVNHTKNGILNENSLPSSSTPSTTVGLASSSVTPDSSTNSNSDNNRPNSGRAVIKVDSSSNATSSGQLQQQQQASSTTTTTTTAIALNEHQLQQLQLHHHGGGDETGSVIGFLLTTTTVNANGELGSLVPGEIVVVPVQSSQLHQQSHHQQTVASSSQILSAATANAIQQAVLSTTTGGSGSGGQSSTTATILPLNSNNSNILSNVISSAVAGINIVNPIIHQTD